ncbi:MAG: hypothetical protein HY908_04520 [Myxococcales bacterium]|nr:hypothetical protein [Myxococcales bacterium]
MPHTVHLELTAPFALGDYCAEVALEDGTSARVVLRKGVYDGALPARARTMRLVLADAPDGEAPLALEDPSCATEPAGPPVWLDALFDAGVPVPADGRLVVQVVWGLPCDAEVPPPNATDGKRFGSWEHILCAERVGLDEHDQPLVARGVRAAVDKSTKLAVGSKTLEFGQIIALAGDFYAHLDDAAKADVDIAAAWPEVGGLLGALAGDYRALTLSADSAAAAQAILGVVFRDRDQRPSIAAEVFTAIGDTLFRGFPGRRYAALASQNFCHFGHQPWDGTEDDAANEALRLYRLYHARALREVAAAPRDVKVLGQAMVVDAFACHFLTDLFASGHIRVPRRALVGTLGIVCGGKASVAAHNEDNQGLWVRMRRGPAKGARVVWRAYGDSYLRTPESLQHLEMVREAVRRSTAEVLLTCAGEKLPAILAEHLIPVPLAPGEGPAPGDAPPDAALLGPKHASAERPTGVPGHNGFPLYALSSAGVLGRRRGDGPTYDLARGKGQFVLGSA